MYYSTRLIDNTIKNYLNNALHVKNFLGNLIFLRILLYLCDSTIFYYVGLRMLEVWEM